MIDIVQESIAWAKNDINNSIDDEVLNISGFSSRKIRIFLNKLVSNTNIKYLEVGSWKGSTFCSALNNNNPEYACSIDNFSQFWESNDSPKLDFLNNADKYISCNYDFYDIDCFNIDLRKIKSTINVYFYDGNHGENDHYKALVYFYPILENEFVFICDDWNWLDVKIGTYRAIRDFNFQISKSFEFTTEYNGDSDGWWNGFFIAILRKTNEKQA